MDIAAHGLWGGIGFAHQGARRYAAAFALGMAPDLFSFGLFHVSQPGWLKLRLAGEISGPPPLSLLPDYIFHAYNLTHSLVVWGAVFALVWWVSKTPPWLLLAWFVHILCDIPTHSSSYFPTPYLWPLPTPIVDGISWATQGFLLTNYSLLLTVYAVVFFRLKRRKISQKKSELRE